MLVCRFEMSYLDYQLRDFCRVCCMMVGTAIPLTNYNVEIGVSDNAEVPLFSARWLSDFVFTNRKMNQHDNAPI
jgi:hypothetical protein